MLIIGDADSGKTSLAASLASDLASEFKTALVDSDLGQSRIGPPTTVAWGIVPSGDFSWDKIRPADFYFVGSTSAVGFLLPTLVGVKKMTDLAQKAAQKIIIDTSGLVRGPGIALKQHKIELIEPDLVIALQHENELEPILTAYKGSASPVIFRLSVPETVKKKSVEERTRWRENNFRRHFQKATKQEIFWVNLAIKNLPLNEKYLADQPKWRLVCLTDQRGRHLALGLIAGINKKQKKYTLLTPLKNMRPVSGLIFSRSLITPDGKQLRR